MGRTIKINFVDFWPGFENNNNYFINTLSQFFKIELSDSPEFIFYSVHGYDHLNYQCPRIFFSGENQTPDFNICDYAVGFQHLNFEDRYLRFPLYFVYDNCLKKAIDKHHFAAEELKVKNRFCDFIFSNSNAHPYRDQFFHDLSTYKEVSSGGKHLNNIGAPVDNKFEFQQESKFSIAFENTSSNGYVTEKIVQAFSAKTIPIYWGDPKIGEEFNSRSFINCHDFESFEKVIEHVKEVDNSDELFMQYLREPIYTDLSYGTNKMNEFYEFFKNIFSQKGEQVYRRNRYYWGKNYEKKLLRQASNHELQFSWRQVLGAFKRKIFN